MSARSLRARRAEACRSGGSVASATGRPPTRRKDRASCIGLDADETDTGRQVRERLPARFSLARSQGLGAGAAVAANSVLISFTRVGISEPTWNPTARRGTARSCWSLCGSTQRKARRRRLSDDLKRLFPDQAGARCRTVTYRCTATGTRVA